MQLDTFLGQVQHLAHLSSIDEALRATRCTFETLSERLEGPEPEKLAAELPSELKPYLHGSGRAERFDSNEFLHRLSDREGVDLPVATHHARVVLEVMQRAVSVGAVEKLQSQLPADFARLFAGSRGKMPHA